MALTFTGATGTSSATIPSHATGDLIIAFAYRDGSTTAPSLPSGENWSNLYNAGGNNSNSHRIAVKVARDGSETTGSFSNATDFLVVVVKTDLTGGEIGYKLGALGSGSSTTLSFTTFTLDNPHSSSRLVLFAGHRSTDVTVNTAPSNYTNITNRSVTGEIAAHRSDNLVSSFSTFTQSVGGSSSGWRTHTFEVWEVPPNQPLTPTLFTNTQTFYSPLFSTQFLTVQQDFGLVADSPDVYFEWGLVTETPATYTHDLGDLDATQNLTAARYNNVNTFYGPTVTATYALTAARFDNTNTFYGPTVSATYALTAARYDNEQTFYGPTVAAIYDITPARYDNEQTFYGPTVAASNALTAARFDNEQTFYAPTVTPSVTLVAARFDNDNTFYEPTVTRGAVELLPGLYENTNTFYSAVITQEGGPQYLVADRFDNTSVFYAPTVAAGAIELLPPFYENAQTFYAPTVAQTGSEEGGLNYRLFAIRKMRR